MKNDKILKICEQKFNFLNYAENTIRCYSFYISEFLEDVNKPYQHLVSYDFQNYLNTYEFSSISQQNQIINAIRFLYKFGLEKKYDKVSFIRPKTEKKLPQVIDSNYLKTKLNDIENTKHKSILSISFSTGMRVSEVINLKIEDIDSKRMIIHIHNGKGRKDRIVPLSQYILELLRTYWKEYKPTEYLFNGQFSNQYSKTSCNKIVKKYLGNEYHFHTLRHSCFTTLLESGTDIRIIQKIAGHQNIKTTEIYTHISTNLLSKINLPI